MQKFFLSLVDLVQSDEFYQSMLNLQLITKEKENVEKSDNESDAKESLDHVDDSSQCNDDEGDVGHILTSSHGIHSDISANDVSIS